MEVRWDLSRQERDPTKGSCLAFALAGAASATGTPTNNATSSDITQRILTSSSACWKADTMHNETLAPFERYHLPGLRALRSALILLRSFSDASRFSRAAAAAWSPAASSAAGRHASGAQRASPGGVAVLTLCSMLATVDEQYAVADHALPPSAISRSFTSLAGSEAARMSNRSSTAVDTLLDVLPGQPDARTNRLSISRARQGRSSR